MLTNATKEDLAELNKFLNEKGLVLKPIIQKVERDDRHWDDVPDIRLLKKEDAPAPSEITEKEGN